MPSPPYIRRHSIRLAGYDYSCEGAYYVTICTHQHTCMFGDVIDGEMVYNDAGSIIEREGLRTEMVRTEVILDEFVILPDHMHAVLWIVPRVGVRTQEGDMARHVPTHHQP